MKHSVLKSLTAQQITPLPNAHTRSTSQRKGFGLKKDVRIPTKINWVWGIKEMFPARCNKTSRLETFLTTANFFLKLCMNGNIYIHWTIIFYLNKRYYINIFSMQNILHSCKIVSKITNGVHSYLRYLFLRVRLQAPRECVRVWDNREMVLEEGRYYVPMYITVAATLVWIVRAWVTVPRWSLLRHVI